MRYQVKQCIETGKWGIWDNDLNYFTTLRMFDTREEAEPRLYLYD